MLTVKQPLPGCKAMKSAVLCPCRKVSLSSPATRSLPQCLWSTITTPLSKASRALASLSNEMGMPSCASVCTQAHASFI